MAATWSELPQDLLMEIAERISVVLQDFEAFRGVCTSWRAAASKPRPRVPLLMLGEASDGHREFYSVSRRKICTRLPLPEAEGKKCIQARFGWFLTIGSSMELHLWNPFSGTQIELPNQTDFLCPIFYIERAVLSANPSGTSDFILALVHGSGLYLSCWRPGDEAWTSTSSIPHVITDINFHHGKLYAICYLGSVWTWDFMQQYLMAPERIFKVGCGSVMHRMPYLVESSSGELLVVVREASVNHAVTGFRVIRLDLTRRVSQEIRSLGDNAIFVGSNAAALCVHATNFPGMVKPDSIYFSEDCTKPGYQPALVWGTGGKEMGVYRLEDRKIERVEDARSFFGVCPPVWVTPSF